jgi:hypothetical protein
MPRRTPSARRLLGPLLSIALLALLALPGAALALPDALELEVVNESGKEA